MMLVLNENLSEGQDQTKDMSEKPTEEKSGTEAVSKDIEAKLESKTAGQGQFMLPLDRTEIRYPRGFYQIKNVSDNPTEM